MGGSVLPPLSARLAHFGDWDAHVQSVARLSLPWDDNLWAAVSRSNPGSDGGADVFIVHMGGARGADGSRWLYQNASLITECDTGDVYLLATNNVDFNGAANSGTEYADLMQVERDGVGGDMGLPLISFRALSAGGSARRQTSALLPRL